MKDKNFAVGFIAGFVIVLVVLFFMFNLYSSKEMDGGVLSAFWSVLIFLFLIFGIIVVSLYMNYVKKRGRNYDCFGK
ncbi:MAG: hypothetical protein ABIG28_00545 [archaeon]